MVVKFNPNVMNVVKLKINQMKGEIMSEIFEVKSPILGFEHIRKIKLERVDNFFVTIKDAENDDVVFTLVNPFVLREYEFNMPTSMKVLLDVSEASNLKIYNVVVLQQPIDESKVNFLAPLVFNEDNKTVGQIVLSALEYPQFSFAEDIKKFVA